MENKTSDQQIQENPNSNHIVLSSDDEEIITPYNNDKQIVVYNPETANQNSQTNIPEQGSNPGPPPQRVLPSVGAFTVQCAECYKWRLIPTKEKYEEIREHIMVQPFRCELAKEWRAEISCDVAGDIEQDNTRLWAIDKPSIAQPPPGWERELRIRGEGSSKFADVYYISPLGKRLRSMVEVQKYLYEHPEFIAQGVMLSHFSFKIPKPLQENYVRKRSPQVTLSGGSKYGMPTIEASPLSWVSPTGPASMQLVRADDITPPAKKKARMTTKHTYNNPFQHGPTSLPSKIKIKGPQVPPNGV